MSGLEWNDIGFNAKRRYNWVPAKASVFSGKLTKTGDNYILGGLEIYCPSETIGDYEGLDVEIYGKEYSYANNGEIISKIIPQKIRKIA